jgi:hypothetical protein
MIPMRRSVDLAGATVIEHIRFAALRQADDSLVTLSHSLID